MTPVFGARTGYEIREGSRLLALRIAQTRTLKAEDRGPAGTRPLQDGVAAAEVTVADRIARVLSIAGYAMSLEQIARTLRCRTADVRIALRADARFQRVEDASGARPRYLYTLTHSGSAPSEPPAGRGRAGRGIPAPGSQASRILAVLSDHSWHTTAEIHRRVGGCVLHSRIAELRKRGFVIEHETTGPGASGSRYRLLDERRFVERDGSSREIPSPLLPSRSPEQLVLEVAA